MLCRCFRRKRRVRVVTRANKCVRGVCTGYLKLFDKHMNMLLRHLKIYVVWSFS